MNKEMVIQARKLFPKDILFINKLITDNPSWHRTKLSKEICKIWNWYTPYGQMKDMACRSMLLKLDKLGYITLPSLKRKKNKSSGEKSIVPALHTTTPVNKKLKQIIPLEIEQIKTPHSLHLFKTFFSLYHYLGFSTTVGENMKYLVFDKNRTPLGCLLFGSSAWKTEPRDLFIGWDEKTRKQNLHFITNNQRFLILPWINVKYLASHILGKISKRISNDWQEKYKHPIYMLETFVEKDRFAGTCYQASNWIRVGETKGRSRNDRYSNMKVPVKDIYLYPTIKNYKKELLSC